MAGLAPKLPLRRDELDGYQLIKTFEELTQQNLKMLVLTNPGERIMDPEFGVGLKKFLFEQNGPMTHGEIESRIRLQVSAYLPFIKILKIKFSTSEYIEYSGNFLSLGIEYLITPLQLRTTLEVTSDFTLDNLNL